MTEPTADAVTEIVITDPDDPRLAPDPSFEWVTMYHPELPNKPRSRVTRMAHTEVWASRGWELLTERQAELSELLGRTVLDEDFSQAEINQIPAGLLTTSASAEAETTVVTTDPVTTDSTGTPDDSTTASAEATTTSKPKKSTA